MKPNIHPDYQVVDAHCACGATWMTSRPSKDIHLDVCSSCHPFFTGRQKLLDTEGRVDALHQEVRCADGRGAPRPRPRPPRTPKAKAAKKKPKLSDRFHQLDAGGL